MAKRYVSYRSDLADKAAWDVEIAAALASYIVSVNDGASTFTTIAVGAQIA